ncbi:MAG TPA: hypothetical protein VER32_14085 [Pyrinomonadaceae bacterium]|nr:hypothetical protein [Pyrinomonadaceae bacterium]
MPGVLTTASSVTCMHGGSAILTTTNALVTVKGAPALLQTDVHAVAGCPFQIPVGVGTKPSPCVRVVWLTGTFKLTVGGVGVLTQSSLGLCLSVEGIPQGIAVVGGASPATAAL